MKQLFDQSTQEKKADQLWDSFEEANQDKFWKKYEALIQKSTTAQPLVIASSKTNASVSNSNEAVFHRRFQAAVIPYAVRVIFFLGLLAAIVLNHRGYYTLPDNPILHIAVAIGTPAFLVLLWRMLIFEVYDQGLLVTTSILRKKQFFLWEEIKLIDMYVDPDNKSLIPKVTLQFKNGQSQAFSSPIRNEIHHDLKELLEGFGVKVFINF